MASQYRVTQVHGSNPWTSDYGEMLSWSLQVDNLTEGTNGYVEINSKPNNAYTVGKEFWAEVKGERNGVLKLKTVQAPKPGFGAPPLARQAPTPSPSQQTPPASPQAMPPGQIMALPARKAMPYVDAMALVKKLAEDVKNDGLLIAMFRSIVDGSVENPVKPRTVIRYYGNELETAGIEQAAWDEIDALSKELIAETDEKHVKSLLIATCQVQSRKDLTAEKAKLFAQTLRTNIAMARERKANEPPDMSDIPF